MKQPIDKQELKVRIELNYKRLADDAYYQIGQVFAPGDYDWYGDKEGRALLAFVSHYKMSGNIIPCMEQMLEKITDKMNDGMYFGPVFDGTILEQQLSGHSWLLRGLCEHYEQFGDELSLRLVKGIVENLYTPTKGKYSSYPIDRQTGDEGGVSGSEIGVVGQWKLSSDIGCAFMSIDGLSHAYKLTGDSNLKELIDEMVDVYVAVDKLKLKVQTHCTLTAARGMMRMYGIENDSRYLDGAREIYDLYISSGMTYTYQNINWWGRPDTWTEPCAIVDSLMLALELYKATGNADYRTTAARVYHNGLATAQRICGGAGTDTLVCEDSPWNYLAIQMYEAEFCCSMRLAEGLWYVSENVEHLYAEIEGKVTKKGCIYADGDIIYAQIQGGAKSYAEKEIVIDGHTLSPIVKYYKVPKEIAENSKQRIIFE